MSGKSPGRPRSEKSRDAVLAATIDLLLESGYSALTLEGIASRAGVGRQTLYRWWASKEDIVAECISDGRMLPTELPVPDSGDIREDLTSWLAGFAEGLDEEHAASRARVLTAATAESAAVARAFRERISQPYRTSLVERIRRGMESGELQPSTPAGLIAEVLLGATMYSVLLRTDAREPVELLAAALLDGIAAEA